jgi:hypothetical protein
MDVDATYILRKVFGPSKSPDGSWRLRNNDELDKIIGMQNIVGQVKAKTLGWFGHIQRMEHRITRKISNWMPSLLNRPKGRPKERWLIACGKVLRLWIGKRVLDRTKWQELLEEAKTHPGL